MPIYGVIKRVIGKMNCYMFFGKELCTSQCLGLQPISGLQFTDISTKHKILSFAQQHSISQKPHLLLPKLLEYSPVFCARKTA